jgi:hypothetical protein
MRPPGTRLVFLAALRRSCSFMPPRPWAQDGSASDQSRERGRVSRAGLGNDRHAGCAIAVLDPRRHRGRHRGCLAGACRPRPRSTPGSPSWCAASCSSGCLSSSSSRAPTSPRRWWIACSRSAPSGGSASPADVFNAGLIRSPASMSEQARFGLFEDNALAIAAVFRHACRGDLHSAWSRRSSSAVMVEMYVGLLAGMIMLGLGGSSFTKDFAVRYLVYAFSVGMKLMALVMIARIGSEVLLGQSRQRRGRFLGQFLDDAGIAGISVVVFIISIYVPNIIQGVVQGVSVTGGMEVIRHGGQAGELCRRQRRPGLGRREGRGLGLFGCTRHREARLALLLSRAWPGASAPPADRSPRPRATRPSASRAPGAPQHSASPMPSSTRARAGAVHALTEDGQGVERLWPPPSPLKIPISPRARNGMSATAPTSRSLPPRGSIVGISKHAPWQ